MKNNDELLADARENLLSDDPDIIDLGVSNIRKLADNNVPEAVYAIATWRIHEMHGFENVPKIVEKELRFAAESLVRDAIYDLAVFEGKSDSPGHLRRSFSLALVAAILGDKQAVGDLESGLFYGIGVYKDQYSAKLLAKLRDQMSN